MQREVRWFSCCQKRTNHPLLKQPPSSTPICRFPKVLVSRATTRERRRDRERERDIYIYIHTYMRCRVNKWSTTFHSVKIVVSEEFSEPIFRGVCRVFVVFWCFGQKKAFKQKWQNLPFSFVGSGGCCFMLLLDCKKRSGKRKKPTNKFFFFANPFLREGKGR